jgi:hypothetical protein
MRKPARHREPGSRSGEAGGEKIEKSDACFIPPGRDFAGQENVRIVKPAPEIDARYRELSPMMRDMVDGLVARGIGLDQAMRGLA